MNAHRMSTFTLPGLLVAGIVSILALGTAVRAQSPAKDVHSQTIYIAPIGDNDVGKVIREKLVADLAAQFMILDAADEADLILTGSNVWNASQQYDSSGQPHTAVRI